MNKNLIATALIAFASLAGLPAYAAGDHAGHGTAQAGAAEMQMVDGQVKKVDKAAGKVTLSHGPLANLNMPAMTMVFAVRDKRLLDGLKVGDAVGFTVQREGSQYVLIRIER